MDAFTLILTWFFALCCAGCFARAAWHTRQYDTYKTEFDRGTPWYWASLAFAALQAITVTIGPTP